MFFKKKEEKKSKDVLYERIQVLLKRLSEMGSCEHAGFKVLHHGLQGNYNQVMLFTDLGWRVFKVDEYIGYNHKTVSLEMYRGIRQQEFSSFKEFERSYYTQGSCPIFQIEYDVHNYSSKLEIKPMLGTKLTAKQVDLAILELEKTVDMYYKHTLNMKEIHKKEVEKLVKGEQ